MNFVFADQVADGGIGNQDLHAIARPLAVRLGQQALAENAFQHQRELRPNLRLLVRRKHVDDAVDGRSRRVGVQRAERQVAGFGDAQRRFDGLQVAHFADQHHVRVFTKGGAQRVGEALGVGVHFALVDHAVLVHVHEFDRVFDGQDVFVALGVDLVDHGGQRGGLAGPGRPGHQHQPARLVAQLAHDGRQAQLVEAT